MNYGSCFRIERSLCITAVNGEATSAASERRGAGRTCACRAAAPSNKRLVTAPPAPPATAAHAITSTRIHSECHGQELASNLLPTFSHLIDQPHPTRMKIR